LSGGTEEKSSASPIAEIAPPPPPPSPVTDDKDPVVAEKVNTAMEENEKKEVKTMRSRSATILTTGHGLLKGPTSARRTLMGS
jgi:hypothetical protein